MGYSPWDHKESDTIQQLNHKKEINDHNISGKNHAAVFIVRMFSSQDEIYLIFVINLMVLNLCF